MVAYNKINQFPADICQKVHNLSTSADSCVIALTAAANAPVATNSVRANLTEISYTNLSSRTLTISSSAQSSGTFKLVITDKTLTASGGAVAAFQYAVLYNDTPTSPADPLIAWWNYGSAITLADGDSVTLDFDDTNGVFQIT